MPIPDPDKHRFEFEAPGWRISATGLGLAVLVFLALIGVAYVIATG